MKKRVNWIENKGENWYKILENCTFGWKIKPSISGSKCERDKLFFLRGKRGQSDLEETDIKQGPNQWKSQKCGSSPRNFPTIPKIEGESAMYVNSFPGVQCPMHPICYTHTYKGPSKHDNIFIGVEKINFFRTPPPPLPMYRPTFLSSKMWVLHTTFIVRQQKLTHFKPVSYVTNDSFG